MSITSSSCVADGTPAPVAANWSSTPPERVRWSGWRDSKATTFQVVSTKNMVRSKDVVTDFSSRDDAKRLDEHDRIAALKATSTCLAGITKVLELMILNACTIERTTSAAGCSFAVFSYAFQMPGSKCTRSSNQHFAIRYSMVLSCSRAYR